GPHGLVAWQGLGVLVLVVTLSTVQVDFYGPERFGLHYVVAAAAEVTGCDRPILGRSEPAEGGFRAGRHS
ncbi:MAG TPA: hypothetical protein VIV12_30000, partial [Streptosporangiaceae bacterium]